MGVGSTKLGGTTMTMSPAATLVAMRTREIIRVAVAMLEGVTKIPLFSCVNDSVRTIACHVSHTRFFQSEHGAGLIKGRNRIILWKIKVVTL